MRSYPRYHRRRPPVHFRDQPSARRWRLPSRIMASLVLFILVYSLSLPVRPWSETLLGYVRYALSWEYDFAGVLRRLVAAALPGGISLDALRGFWGTRPRPGSGTDAGAGLITAASSRCGPDGRCAGGNAKGLSGACPHPAVTPVNVTMAVSGVPPVPCYLGGRGGRRLDECHGQAMMGPVRATTGLHLPYGPAVALPRWLPAGPVSVPA